MKLEGLSREGNLPYWLLGTSFAAILAILGIALLPYWLYRLAWVLLGRYLGVPGGFIGDSGYQNIDIFVPWGVVKPS